MTRPASPPPSRRAVVAALTFGSVAAGALAAPFLGFTRPKLMPSAASLWRREYVNLATAGINEWSGQIGSAFELESELGATSVRLQKVEPLISAGRRPLGVSRDRAFALTFASVGTSAPRGDRIYAMRHPASGDLKIYFSPSGKTLLAVFN